MFRLMGFFLGVCLAIAVLAMVVDAPTRQRAEALATELTNAAIDAVDRLTPSRDAGTTRSEARVAASLAHPDTTPVAETYTGQVASKVRAPVEETIEAAGLQVDSGTADANRASPQDAVDASFGDVVSADVDSLHPTGEGPLWEPVWRAFRSELSAKGFAGQLQRLTGREYRVRRTSPQAYQVELSYADEDQRDAVLEQIRDTTGLGLEELRP